MAGTDVQIAIIGGGFYGCMLALFFRSISESIIVIEAGHRLFERASRVNQARLHAGFHYPRSFVTAIRCRTLQRRFARDFEDAIVADFDMLYAVAARRSKVTAERFIRMFKSVEAPISLASARHRALFDGNLVDEVFVCKEFAFDWSILRDRIAAKLDACGIKVLFDENVERLSTKANGATAQARYVFNVTYANINNLLLRSGLQRLDLKHELAEILLVRPPPELDKCAVTVMDGPFFSTMPYPSRRLYSLTHVRYTPHYSWVDATAAQSAYEVANDLPHETRWKHMMMDARRYVPCLAGIRYEESMFEVKTVLVKHERDDARPILLSSHNDAPHLYSVLGAKIDNIYDLFDVLPAINSEWRNANANWVYS
jgi:glycine/D-amino acid oxidase-like deaminating enzyme